MDSKLIQRIGKNVPSNRLSIVKDTVTVNRSGFYPRLQEFLENPTFELPSNELRIYEIDGKYYSHPEVVSRSIKIDDIYDIHVINSNLSMNGSINYIETNLAIRFLGYFYILDPKLSASMFEAGKSYLIIADGKISFVNSFYDIPFAGLSYLAIYESPYDIKLLKRTKTVTDNELECPVCHSPLSEHGIVEEEIDNAYYRLDEYRASKFIDPYLQVVSFTTDYHPYYFKPFNDIPIYAVRVKETGKDLDNNSLDLYVATNEISTLEDFRADDNIRVTPNSIMIENSMTNEEMRTVLRNIKTWNSQFKMARPQANRDIEKPILSTINRAGGGTYTAYVFEYSMDFIYLYRGVFLENLNIVALIRSNNTNGTHVYSEGGTESYVVLQSWNYDISKLRILRPSFTDTFFKVVDGRLIYTDTDDGESFRDRILLYHYHILNFKRTSFFDMEHMLDLTHQNVVAIDSGGLLLMEPGIPLDQLLDYEVLETKELNMYFRDNVGFISNRNMVIKDITSLMNSELLDRGIVSLPSGYVYLFINNILFTEDDFIHIGGIYYMLKPSVYQFSVSNIKVYISDENSTMLEMRYRALDFLASLDFYTQESIENHIISNYEVRLIDNNYVGNRYYDSLTESYTLVTYNHLMVQMGMLKELMESDDPADLVRYDLMVEQIQEEFPDISITELLNDGTVDPRLVITGDEDPTYTTLNPGEDDGRA
jgi:hypothetical protein